METKRYRNTGWIRCILAYWVIIPLFSCAGNNRDMNYQMIVSDFSSQSIFIPINVINCDSIFHIVIRNGDLYSILSHSLSLEDYQKAVLSSLNANEPLEVDAMDFVKLDEFRLDNKNEVISLSMTKVEDIIDKYFNDEGVCVGSASDTEQRAIIDLLFSKYIYVKMDCETGLYYIVNKDNAK